MRKNDIPKDILRCTGFSYNPVCAGCLRMKYKNYYYLFLNIIDEPLDKCDFRIGENNDKR